MTHQWEALKGSPNLRYFYIYNFSALAPVISAEKVEISGKVEIFHSFQREKSTLRKSL